MSLAADLGELHVGMAAIKPSRTVAMITPCMENAEPSRRVPCQPLHSVSPSMEATSSAVKSGMLSNIVDQFDNTWSLPPNPRLG